MNEKFLNFEINRDRIINFPKNILVSDRVDVGDTVVLQFQENPILIEIIMIDSENITGRLLCDVYDEQSRKIANHGELVQFFGRNISSILDVNSG